MPVITAVKLGLCRGLFPAGGDHRSELVEQAVDRHRGRVATLVLDQRADRDEHAQLAFDGVAVVHVWSRFCLGRLGSGNHADVLRESGMPRVERAKLARP